MVFCVFFEIAKWRFMCAIRRPNPVFTSAVLHRVPGAAIPLKVIGPSSCSWKKISYCWKYCYLYILCYSVYCQPCEHFCNWCRKVIDDDCNDLNDDDDNYLLVSDGGWIDGWRMEMWGATSKHGTRKKQTNTHTFRLTSRLTRPPSTALKWQALALSALETWRHSINFTSWWGRTWRSRCSWTTWTPWPGMDPTRSGSLGTTLCSPSPPSSFHILATSQPPLHLYCNNLWQLPILVLTSVKFCLGPNTVTSYNPLSECSRLDTV